MVKKKYARKIPFKPIMVHATLYDKVKFLSEVTGLTYSKVLEQIITPIFEIASTYNKCTFEVYDQVVQRNVLIQFYGSDKSLILGEIKDPECLGDRTNDILDEKALQNVMDVQASQASKKKTEKIKVTQKIAEIKGEIKNE
jgi:hypothetical protein